MKTFAWLPALLLALGLLRAQDAAPSLEGTYVGALTFGGTKIRLVVNLAAKEGGGYSATIDSPDQGARGIPVAEVTLEGRALTLKVSAVQGTYTGEVAADGKTIKGTWAQGGAKLPLNLTRGEPLAALKRPQLPKGPFPYTSQDVTFSHSGVTLAGTLTLPQGPGPHPGVVLVTGSGPQDRDETILGHKPFLVIADHLTRAGVAVLRYDDRGVGKSTGDFAKATTREFADDARAAWRYLAGRKELDPKRIGVCGHSEGGLIAPMVAVEEPGVGFAILLAGPGVDGSEVIALQSRIIGEAMGASQEDLARGDRLGNPLRKIAASDLSDAEARAALRKEAESQWEGFSPLEKAGISKEKYVSSKVDVLLSPWFRHFLRYDPRPTLRKLTCPVLALNGAKDLQVDAGQNLPVIGQCLEEAKNQDYALIKLPGLNHLFQRCKSGAPSEYGEIEETFAPRALKVLSDWIRAR